ncbi:MAG: DNA polymerase III subunit delta [Betaproteobacteria bacterium]|jgi:DNA polymerase III, delta subunit|nr:DNA polymerase III subunit delta [Betaproteobacteria bacterium]
MRLNPEQLSQHLRKHTPPLLTVMGNEALISQEICQTWKTTVVPHAPQRYSWSMDARSSWDDIEQIWRSGSLFDAHTLLEIRIPGGKPGTLGAQTLERLARMPLPDHYLLIILPELDSRTRKSSWFTTLESAGLLIEAKPVPRAQLPQWLAQRLRQRERQISQEALEFLAACTEGNLLAANQEVEKLCLLYPDGPLTLEQVQSAVMMVSRHTLNSLVDALAQRQPGQAGIALRSLHNEGEALTLILWNLCEDWRALYYLTSAKHEDQTKSLRLWGDRKNRLLGMRHWVRPLSCQHALKAASHLDQMIKGLVPGDPWEALLEILLEFMR